MKTMVHVIVLILLTVNLYAQCSVDFFSNEQSYFSPNTHKQQVESIAVPFHLEHNEDINRTSIEWSVVEGVNAQYYFIQRSVDGNVYENIKTIEQELEPIHSYRYIILEKESMLCMYRIQIVYISEDGSVNVYTSKAKSNNIRSIPQAESYYEMGLDWY